MASSGNVFFGADESTERSVDAYWGMTKALIFWAKTGGRCACRARTLQKPSGPAEFHLHLRRRTKRASAYVIQVDRREGG